MSKRYRDYLQSELWEENKRFVGQKQQWKCAIPKCDKWIVDFHHYRGYAAIWTEEDVHYIKGVCRIHHRLCHYKWLGLIKIKKTEQELLKRYKAICSRSWGRLRPSDFFKLWH
jgi:hypothetical protein